MENRTLAALLDQPLPHRVAMNRDLKGLLLAMMVGGLFFELFALSVLYSDKIDKEAAYPS